MGNWRKIKLGDISDMCLGKMLDKEKNQGDLHPYLANINVRWGNFDLKNLNRMRFEKSEHDRYGLTYGDIVVCEGGEPGRCAIWTEKMPDMKFQKALHRVRLKEGFSNQFVYYRFLLAGRNGDLEKYFIGSTIKHLTGISLKEVEFTYPSLTEQQKIAAVLSALDAKIELNQRINAELEAMAKTIYDYWFVQFDFPDEHGEPYKSSGGKMVWSEALKREIPAGWEVKGLGNYAQPIRGVTYKKEEVKNSSDKDTIPILRATNINNAVIDLHDMVYVPAELVAEDQILDKFDVLITMSSGSKAHVGKNAFYYFDKKVSFGAFCSRLSVKKNLRFYVNTHMQSDNFKKYIANVGLGTNINNLTNRHITEYKLLIPSEKLLLKYEEIVENFYNEIGNNIKESQTLTELRDWLLPMLMNGQVTVKTQDDIGNPNAA